MRFPDRAVSPPRLTQVACFLVGSLLLVACASAAGSPSPAAGTTDELQPSATAIGAVTLEGVPTACVGLGEPTAVASSRTSRSS